MPDETRSESPKPGCHRHFHFHCRLAAPPHRSQAVKADNDQQRKRALRTFHIAGYDTSYQLFVRIMSVSMQCRTSTDMSVALSMPAASLQSSSALGDSADFV